MDTQKRQLKRTVSIHGIIEDSTAASYSPENRNPKRIMACFNKWPIEEIRLACLEGMKQSFWRLECFDWARETIVGLIEVRDPSMALKIMELYENGVLTCVRSCLRGCSIRLDDVPQHLYYYGTDDGTPELWTEFVKMLLLAVRMSNVPEFSGPMLKLVCRCVDPVEFPGCYYHEELQPVGRLFTAVLDGVNSKYEESDWRRAERVLRIIAKAADSSYIDQLKLIAAAHESDDAGPEFGKPFSAVANLAILKETVRILEQAPAST